MLLPQHVGGLKYAFAPELTSIADLHIVVEDLQIYRACGFTLDHYMVVSCPLHLMAEAPSGGSSGDSAGERKLGGTHELGRPRSDGPNKGTGTQYDDIVC